MLIREFTKGLKDLSKELSNYAKVLEKKEDKMDKVRSWHRSDFEHSLEQILLKLDAATKYS